MKKLITLVFVFLSFYGFVQTNPEIKKPKKHVCSEYLYRLDTVTNTKDTVLVNYCVYDIKKKKIIHNYNR